MQAREFLSKLGDLHQTLIFAKIENTEASCRNFIAWIPSSCLFVSSLDIDFQVMNLICSTVLQGLTHFDEILREAAATSWVACVGSTSLRGIPPSRSLFASRDVFPDEAIKLVPSLDDGESWDFSWAPNRVECWLQRMVECEDKCALQPIQTCTAVIAAPTSVWKQVHWQAKDDQTRKVLACPTQCT